MNTLAVHTNFADNGALLHERGPTDAERNLLSGLRQAGSDCYTVLIEHNQASKRAKCGCELCQHVMHTIFVLDLLTASLEEELPRTKK